MINNLTEIYESILDQKYINTSASPSKMMNFNRKFYSDIRKSEQENYNNRIKDPWTKVHYKPTPPTLKSIAKIANIHKSGADNFAKYVKNKDLQTSPKYAEARELVNQAKNSPRHHSSRSVDKPSVASNQLKDYLLSKYNK